jgi:Flp pilus assembly protein TadG
MIRRASAASSRARRSSRGQTLVEFALVAPMFFLVLFSIVEGARFIFYYEMLNNATRDGARYAIVHGENSFDPTGPPNDPTGADVITRVKQSAVGILGSAVTVTPTWTIAGVPAPNERGTTVTVHASYTYSSVIPIVPLPPITVEAESSLVVNN